MLPVWIRFKRWIRSLLVSLSTDKPIDWTEKGRELGKIIQDAKAAEGSEPKRRRIGWRLRRRTDA